MRYPASANMLSGFLQDVRFGWRSFRASPGMAAISVVTLAVALATNVAIFSVIDGLFLRPLPVDDPSQIVSIYTSQTTSRGEEPLGRTSYPDYLDLRAQSKTLSGMVLQEGRGIPYDDGSGSKLLLLNAVSDNYFEVMTSRPLLGRFFTEQEVASPDARPVVISSAFWRRELHGDPSVVGRTINLHHQSCLVVGVLRPEFRGTRREIDPDIWMPISAFARVGPGDSSNLVNRQDRFAEVFGRMRPGVSVAQVQAELNAVAAQLAAAYPKSNSNKHISVRPASREDSNRVAALTLALPGLVLLIACVNVANLLLARGDARQREIAIRVAIGAERRRLLRQLFTENLLLALASGVLGVALATWIVEIIVPLAMPPAMIPIGPYTRIDLRALLFALAATTISVLAFGVAPALRNSRLDLTAAMKRTEASEGRQRFSFRSMLVAGEIALSVVLLAISGLLIRSLLRLQAFDPGFNTRQNMLLVEFAPGPVVAGGEQYSNYFRDLQDGLRSLPGVEGVAWASCMPLAGSGTGAAKRVLFPGIDLPSAAGVNINYARVSAGYFETAGTRIVGGRSFTAADGANSPRVVIVNQAMAAKYWPGRNAIGQRIRIAGPGEGDHEIVGIAQDGKYSSLTEATKPYLYLSAAQHTLGDTTLLIRTAVDAGTLAAPVRQKLRTLDPGALVMDVMTLRQHMRFATYLQWLPANVVSSLGGLGLLFAAVGLYGLVAFSVGRRTREFGVRMAMGARPGAIFSDVLGRALRLVLLGLVVGLAASLVVARLLASALYGVSASDPLTLVVSALVLTAVALLASYVPAIRATKVDPMVALRYE